MSETGRTISGKSVGGSCWRGIVCKFSVRENNKNLLASSKREEAQNCELAVGILTYENSELNWCVRYQMDRDR